MIDLEVKYFKNRQEWRSWLITNHHKSVGIWLVRIKKDVKKPCVKYDDAVEEALCFGWIDGQIKSVDKEKYLLRMCPRRPRSVWSKLNTERAEKMIKQGLMTAAGMEKIEHAKQNGAWENAYSSKDTFEIPADLEKALKKDKIAWLNFQNFSNSSQRIYCDVVIRVKREETRRKWIKTIVERARLNKRPGIV